ncbi:VC0807 family protein [Rheinheimera tangshanensis]|uniref:MFS transporter n=1 Tax=Rheinheimera tangshanensis TaxID=400153 RepID=A0A5C8LT17_9GAMM|nr:VC0807 family protein [Rheinheimera tangshanensis]MBP8226507.1 MFS transporter [Rheinheimera sp.]TXK79153.1 MFS transporter [Rheinheimera tangshanensis]GGM67765.1 MFS transporter [Rheinheimera tangshanensis]
MSQTEKKKSSGFLVNLIFNIVIPTLILSKLSEDHQLGPVWALVVALAFPLGFGLWELQQSKKVNFLSVLGVISVLLTGGISLLQLDPAYIAIKEAAVPGIIALLVLVSQRSKYPLVKKILLNDELMDLAKLDASLKAHNAEQLFASKLQNCAYLVAGSFVVSSVLNYGLAKYLLVSAPGTPAFNEELAKMTALSFPVIALPCTVMLMVAIWYLFSQIGKVTGESIESFLRQ